MSVKLAIMFYSTYGTNQTMAEIATEAAKAAGAEVRLLRIAETAPDAVVEGQPAWKAQVERASPLPVATPLRGGGQLRDVGPGDQGWVFPLTLHPLCRRRRW